MNISNFLLGVVLLNPLQIHTINHRQLFKAKTGFI